MNNIDEIFFRGDIQQIREFLLRGVEEVVDPCAYKERGTMCMQSKPFIWKSACSWARGLPRRYSRI